MAGVSRGPQSAQSIPYDAMSHIMAAMIACDITEVQISEVGDLVTCPPFVNSPGLRPYALTSTQGGEELILKPLKGRMMVQLTHHQLCWNGMTLTKPGYQVIQGHLNLFFVASWPGPLRALETLPPNGKSHARVATPL